MPSHITAKVVGSTVVALCLAEGYYGLKCREYTHLERPEKYKNSLDPRIRPASSEGPLLKFMRHFMCNNYEDKTHYFGVKNFREALNRPEGVGLLTVSNHVTTIDSCCLCAPQIHFSDMLNTRNCGYWNLAKEDNLFDNIISGSFLSLSKVMPIHRGGGVYQIGLTNYIERVKYGEWVHIFPEGRTYQDQLHSCWDDQGRRIRASGRTGPPGRSLGPMKWGVGRVIYEAATMREGETASFERGVNNGKLWIMPFYHLNMEKILPEDEKLNVISIIPGKKVEVYCKFGKPVDVSDIFDKSKQLLLQCKSQSEKDETMFIIYKELTERVESSLEALEYELKDIRAKDQL